MKQRSGERVKKQNSERVKKCNCAARELGAGDWCGDRLDLPYVEVVFVAGGGHFQSLGVGGAIQSGSDVFLGVGQGGEGNLERGAGHELVDVAQQSRHDPLVLSIPALRHIQLKNGLETLRFRI